MYCKSCNQPLDDDAAVCNSCGAPVEDTDSTPSPEPESVFTQTAASEPTFPMNTQQPAEVAQDAGMQASAAAVAAAASNYAGTQAESGYAQPQNPAGYQADYASGRPMTPSEQQGSDIGVVPLVLGILSIVLAVFFGWTIIAAIAGIVLGILGMSKGKKALAIEPDNGKAKGGRITGIIGLILSILALIGTIALAAIFGVMVTQAVNNPDAFIEEMEKIAETDETGQLQQDIDDLKQELNQLESSTDLDSDPSDEMGSPAAPSDYTGGEAFDTWAAECTANGDQPTLYALTELKGWQLETMLQKLGYQWYPDVNTWVRESDGTYYGMIGTGSILTDEQIAKGDLGGAGLDAYHVLVVKGFSSARDALNQMGQVVVEDATFTDDGTSALAVVHGPSMSEYLVMVQPSEDDGQDYYSFIMFPQETVASGQFSTFVGSDMGTTIPEVWQNITGGAVGDTIANS